MEPVTYFFGGWEPVARILVVGSLAYVSLLVLLRISGKRTLAQMSAFDLIVTVALGASFGRILTARSVALVEALAVFALLISLQYVVSWLQVRFPGFARAVMASPSLLYYRGSFLREAMRRERVAESDLFTAIREQGAGSFDQVEAVVLEADGKFAVINSATVGDRSALQRLQKREPPGPEGRTGKEDGTA